MIIVIQYKLISNWDLILQQSLKLVTNCCVSEQNVHLTQAQIENFFHRVAVKTKMHHECDGEQFTFLSDLDDWLTEDFLGWKLPWEITSYVTN